VDFGDNRHQPNPMNPNPRPPSYNNVLLRTENYHTIPNVEDRLFVPEQYVPLFVRYPRTQISPLFTVQGLQRGCELIRGERDGSKRRWRHFDLDSAPSFDYSGSH